MMGQAADDDGRLKVKIPDGTQTGHKIRIKGRAARACRGP